MMLSDNSSKKRIYDSCINKLAKFEIFKISLFAFFCIFLSACEKKNVINEAFKKKYGKEIEQMKLDRAAPQVAKSDAKYDFEPPSAAVAKDNFNSKNSELQPYYANVDAEEYSKTKPKQFFPDSNVYNEGKSAQTLPENLFELSYNTTLSPPFRVVKSEFDLVRIPPYDFYGVRTALEEKQYTLIGNNYLQKNIDVINATKSQDDLEMSKTLIQEQRQLKRKYRMEKIFGKKEPVTDDSKVDLEKENQEKISQEKLLINDTKMSKNSEQNQNDIGENLKKENEKQEGKKTETIIDKILKIN